MVKVPSITLMEDSSYIVIANSEFNVGKPGVYIVYASGNPKTIFKLCKSEGLFNPNLDVYYQLENIEFLRNHSEVVATKGDATLYKYKGK